MSIKQDCSKQDAILIRKISIRASKIDKGIPLLHINMDFIATHCNGNPLRLKDLLKADDFNFAHDYFGIKNCLNRKTGKHENCFVPRFTIRGLK